MGSSIMIRSVIWSLTLMLVVDLSMGHRYFRGDYETMDRLNGNIESVKKGMEKNRMDIAQMNGHIETIAEQLLQALKAIDEVRMEVKKIKEGSSTNNNNSTNTGESIPDSTTTTTTTSTSSSPQ